MLHIYTNAEYADMMYVYGFCNGSAAAAAVEEYFQRFPVRRIPDHRVFSKAFSTLCEHGMLPIAHVSSEQVRQQHNMWWNRKAFLKWYSIALLLAQEDFLHILGVSRTRV
jgi:hypothetical protein